MAVAFTVRKEAGQTLAMRDFDVLNAQPHQFIGTKAAPETQQQECAIADMA